MSLFTIVTDVLTANGWPPTVTQVATSSDPAVKQAFVLANAEIEACAFAHDWPIYILPYTIELVPGQVEYTLPTDFYKIISNAVWNADSYYQMRGSLSPADWIATSLNLVAVRTSYKMDPRNNKIMITPTPTAAETVICQYYTNNLVRGQDGTLQPRFVNDGDDSLMDERIIKRGLSWRWRQKKGLDYTAELAEYRDNVKQYYAQQLALGEMPIGGTPYNTVITDGYLGPNFNNSIVSGPSFGS
jgi:hypothetical protein